MCFLILFCFLAQNSMDESLVRNILYDAVILVDYSFINPEVEGEHFNDSTMNIIMRRLIVTHEAIQIVRSGCHLMRLKMPLLIIALVLKFILVTGIKETTTKLYPIQMHFRHHVFPIPWLSGPLIKLACRNSTDPVLPHLSVFWVSI